MVSELRCNYTTFNALMLNVYAEDAIAEHLVLLLDRFRFSNTHEIVATRI